MILSNEKWASGKEDRETGRQGDRETGRQGDRIDIEFFKNYDIDPILFL